MKSRASRPTHSAPGHTQGREPHQSRRELALYKLLVALARVDEHTNELLEPEAGPWTGEQLAAAFTRALR